MIKLLSHILILTIVFLIGISIGLSTPESIKSHFAYTIKKEMQVENKVFYVGDIRFSPTKYKNLYLAEVKKKK